MNTATKPTPGASSSAVKVELDPAPLPSEVTLTRYLVGTTWPECPIQNVHAGGICFPAFRGNPEFNDQGKPDRDIDYGNFVDLTDEQVELVKAGVALRVIRFLGPEREERRFEDAPDIQQSKPRRGVLLMNDTKGYVRHAADKPLARFVFMHRASELTVDMMGTIPETMEA